MTKFSPTQFLILALLLTLVSMAPQIDAQQRCEEILDPNNCVLEDCKERCFEKHQSNGGQCVENGGTPLNPTFKCLCVYDC
ncbi:hypothetical protein QUC31_016377 [Theobroma cacao]|uniref:Defensin-like protein 165 n=2 Tax=Theobroma cacao TaxID=3641 RepID=A0AB32VAD4_THECC|nr:PREDICTED: putative defensin-like protein 165 [Theobroma cacao]EOY06249.1 Uncharacterized protein TCM_021047 [Theobroma cacao]